MKYIDIDSNGRRKDKESEYRKYLDSIKTIIPANIYDYFILQNFHDEYLTFIIGHNDNKYVELLRTGGDAIQFYHATFSLKSISEIATKVWVICDSIDETEFLLSKESKQYVWNVSFSSGKSASFLFSDFESISRTNIDNNNNLCSTRGRMVD